jgi:transposase-like protein
MNKTLQAQAQKLYFQSDLSKTEISEMLGIPRRTLHYWIREKNWDRIKRSAAQMPSLLAENIYHIIARFTQQLLGEDRINRPITRHEADTLHKLVLTISKLKARTTLNESMEMFGTFM